MTLPAPKHIAYLDGWRGLAIICVLIGHFSRTPMLGWLGPFGVGVFFALSGRLMSELLFIKRVKLIDFFVRRASRVLPTFWLFTATVALSTYIWPNWRVNAEELLATLVFLRTYFPPETDIFNSSLPVGHIWSLNVEEHTYVWLAFCALLARVWRMPAQWYLLGTYAVSLAFLAYYVGNPPDTATNWHLRTEVAAMGIVAAAILRCVPLGAIRLLPLASMLPIAACAMSVLCFSMYAHKAAALWLSPLCLAFAVNYLHLLPNLLLRAISARWLQWFGCCSFSIYLWQQPFFVAVNEGRLNPVLALLASLGVGALSYYLFENPLRHYLNRKWAHRSDSKNVKNWETQSKLADANSSS